MTGKTALATTLLVAFAAPAWGELVAHFGATVDHKMPTVQCLACHDGVSASSVSTCNKHMCQIYGSDHPFIAPRYPDRKGKTYATIPQITAEGIELEEGNMVGCNTCHDIRNTHIPGQMVIIKSGKNLCTICHRM